MHAIALIYVGKDTRKSSTDEETVSQPASKSGDMEQLVFKHEEQTRDLKMQLASKHMELTTTQDSYAKLKGMANKEYHVDHRPVAELEKLTTASEEKFRKMKGLSFVFEA